jgi:GTP-binding nuclear protein Ran|tara:strand:- start:3880 stop:4257 length:378 start_codon:yes stop_codon:yes gene_type:complete
MSLKRILVVGDAGVGKTQFINKRIGKAFDMRYIPTLCGIKEYKSSNTIYYDYPGQEIYSQHTISEPIDQVVYLYDMTSRMSFRNIVKWKQYVSDKYGEVDSVLFGTKNDLKDRLRVGAEHSVCNK